MAERLQIWALRRGYCRTIQKGSPWPHPQVPSSQVVTGHVSRALQQASPQRARACPQPGPAHCLLPHSRERKPLGAVSSQAHGHWLAFRTHGVNKGTLPIAQGATRAPGGMCLSLSAWPKIGLPQASRGVTGTKVICMTPHDPSLCLPVWDECHGKVPGETSLCPPSLAHSRRRQEWHQYSPKPNSLGYIPSSPNWCTALGSSALWACFLICERG